MIREGGLVGILIVGLFSWLIVCGLLVSSMHCSFVVCEWISSGCCL